MFLQIFPNSVASDFIQVNNFQLTEYGRYYNY